MVARASALRFIATPSSISIQMQSTPNPRAFWILCMSSPGIYNNARLARISSPILASSKTKPYVPAPPPQYRLACVQHASDAQCLDPCASAILVFQAPQSLHKPYHRGIRGQDGQYDHTPGSPPPYPRSIHSLLG